MNTKIEKALEIELLRIFAIFFVIYNHTGGIESFSWFSFGGKRWFLYSIVSLFCKISVPVFFMISGAMLLGRNEPLRKILKRVTHSLVELVLITLLYIVYKFFRYGEIHGIKDFLIYLVRGSGLSAHLWFMYAYIAFLISIPFLEGIIGILNKKRIYYLFSIILAFRLIEMVQYTVFRNELTVSSYIIPSWLAVDTVTYPLFGWWIYNKKTDYRKADLFKALILILLGLTLPLIELYILGVRNGRTYDGVWKQQFHNQFVLSVAIGVFWLFVIVFRDVHWNNVLKRIILRISSATYGVYIIHIMVKDYPRMKWRLDAMVNGGTEYLLANLIYVAESYIVSVLIIIIFQCIATIFKKCLRSVQSYLT